MRYGYFMDYKQRKLLLPSDWPAMPHCYKIDLPAYFYNHISKITENKLNIYIVYCLGSCVFDKN